MFVYYQKDGSYRRSDGLYGQTGQENGVYRPETGICRLIGPVLQFGTIGRTWIYSCLSSGVLELVRRAFQITLLEISE